MGGQVLSYGTDKNFNGALDDDEATGVLFVCAVTCGSYQCGGACGTCSAGLLCSSVGMCADVDECASPEPVCGTHASCTNTVGSHSCKCDDGYEGDGLVCTEIVRCAAPKVMCGADCVDLSSTDAHCGQCGNVCQQNKTCAAGVCVGAGELRFTSTWSRPGDIDVWVTTPNGVTIGWQSQRGDGGQQDRDDTSGTGPENIYWVATPPIGQYHICVATNYIQPNAANPVSVDVLVASPYAADQVFSRQYSTSVSFSRGQTCSPTHPTYLAAVDVGESL